VSNAKQTSKRKHRACAVPLLGAAGLSLSLASGAPAATEGPVADIPTQNTGVSHDITLGEEEISDVSLATFYVFDKENAGISPLTMVDAAHVDARVGQRGSNARRLDDGLSRSVWQAVVCGCVYLRLRHGQSHPVTLSMIQGF
jgi:hypothetical protein